MKTEANVLKKWIEDADKLTEHVGEFPEEVQEVVSRLANVVRVLSYENIALDEERKAFKNKYGNLLADLYASGNLKEMGVSAWRR